MRPIMTRRLKTPLIAAIAVALTASTGAFAHATLERATPAVGSTVASPSEIRIQLSEPVDPAASGISITSAAGATIATGKALAEGDKKVLVVRIGQRLAPGAYKVRWHAASTDAHKSQGSFGFEVRP
jgi:methionine-rich copper-binding protein CopC